MIGRHHPGDRVDWKNTYENKALDGVADGLAHAWKLFANESYLRPSRSSILNSN